MVVGEQELRTGKAHASHDDGGQHFHGALETAHDHAEPQRNQDGQEGQLTAHDLAHVHFRNTRNLSADDDRDTNGAKGHGGGVGDQTDTSGVQGAEAQAHQHGGGDCHRRTKASGTFNEGTKGKGDKDGLKTAVVRKTGKRFFDVLKFARFYGHVVHPNRRDDDPDDGEEAESGTIAQRAQGRAKGHAPHGNSQNERKSYGQRRSVVPFGTAHGQHVKKADQGDTCQQGGNHSSANRIIHLCPSHITDPQLLCVTRGRMAVRSPFRATLRYYLIPL